MASTVSSSSACITRSNIRTMNLSKAKAYLDRAIKGIDHRLICRSRKPQRKRSEKKEEVKMEEHKMEEVVKGMDGSPEGELYEIQIIENPNHLPEITNDNLKACLEEKKALPWHEEYNLILLIRQYAYFKKEELEPFWDRCMECVLESTNNLRSALVRHALYALNEILACTSIQKIESSLLDKVVNTLLAKCVHEKKFLRPIADEGMHTLMDKFATTETLLSLLRCSSNEKNIQIVDKCSASCLECLRNIKKKQLAKGGMIQFETKEIELMLGAFGSILTSKSVEGKKSIRQCLTMLAKELGEEYMKNMITSLEILTNTQKVDLTKCCNQPKAPIQTSRISLKAEMRKRQMQTKTHQPFTDITKSSNVTNTQVA